MGLRIVAPNLLLPWHASDDDDRRFWRVLGWCLLPFLLLSLAIPFIDTPEPDREELERLPPQLARVVLEEKELPEPPPPKEEPKPEPEEPEPEPEVAEPDPEPVEPKPAEAVQKAREKAQKSGVLKFADDLAQMRDSVDVEEVSSAATTRSEGEAAQLDRALIANRSNTTSEGVDTSKLSRDTGGAALSGRETTQVEDKMAQNDAASADSDAGPSDDSDRNNEAIRKIMDRNKSAIFAIYNRALRTDPTLEGRVVVKIVIEPDGSVSDVEIVSSDLDSPDLEDKILARIRLISFGEEDVGKATLNYTFDFLPS